MPRNKSYRSRHRMRSHEQAHAESGGGVVQPVLDHPMVPASEPPLVTERSGLIEVIDQLRAVKQFAYDSEFIGEETYYPRLCVIQVATAEAVWLLDPIALGEPEALLPFWELLADSEVEKIVHAGQQDLEPVVRHLEKPPASVFDVQVAAAFVGGPYPASLTRLIAEFIGPEAAGSVGAKFSQWDHRPLTPVQMQYAANDVRYLPLLRKVIGERLEEKGNVELARREFDELCDPSLYRFDASSQRLRVRGAERLNTTQRSVLRALLGWRDEQAQQKDVPPRTFTKDNVLFEIARLLIQREEDLHHVKGLPRSVKRDGAERLAAIVREAMTQESPSSGRGYVDRGVERAEVDRLWHAMRERCHERSIEHAIVTSKRELTAWVRGSRAEKPPDLRVLRGWRAELLDGILDG